MSHQKNDSHHYDLALDSKMNTDLGLIIASFILQCHNFISE